MKQFLAPIIVAVGILAGGAGGVFLKNMGKGDAAAEKAADGAHGAEDKSHGRDKSDGHDSKEKKDKGHGKEKGHAKEDKGHGGAKDAHGASDAGGKSYFKFSREFVVPLMSGDRVSELVILNISLETDASLSQTLFSQEPKLRDNIMTTLIGLSNDGVTFESMTAVDNYETLRSTILMNLDSVIADGIDNVLILDLAKQEI
jgi:flagellar protein FliL